VAAGAGSRVFALLRARAVDDSVPDHEAVASRLRACGAGPVVQHELSRDTGDLRDGQNAVLDMKLAGVTSVICLCHAAHIGDKLMPSATSQSFTPEWVLQPFQFQDRETAATTWPQNQAQHAFGVTYRNKWNATQDMPWFWAMKAADPAWEPDASDQGWNQAILERYSELLVLASGIQLAGPRLTPETFREGLQKARFPNPGCGAPPHYQACVGFGPQDFAFHTDGTLIWWSTTERNYTANRRQGAFCYVRRGVRYGAGAWPSGAQPLRTGPCR
jgi:hypothetical protein